MLDWDNGYGRAQYEHDMQEPPESEPVGQCSICGADISEGETVCMVDGEMICSECYSIVEAARDEPDEY